jgi:uncharacterized membrane protein YqaE (UPF0057 family)
VEQNVVMVLTALFAPPEAVWLQRVDFRSAFAVRLPQLRAYITAFLNVLLASSPPPFPKSLFVH